MSIAAGLGEGRWSFAARCDGRDTLSYYYAARGALDGLSPYDGIALYYHFGRIPLFVYPVFALPPLLPLALFDEATALALFALLHVAGLAGLVALWRRAVPVDWRLLALLLPVGLGAAAVHNVCSGNVVTFEALALLAGLLALWRGRIGRFALWTVLAAAPKLLWLALLPLALLRDRAAWRLPALALLGFIVALAAWGLLWRDGLEGWLFNLRGTSRIRYSVFTLLRDLDHWAGGGAGGPLLQRWESWGYALWLALIGLVLAVLVRRGLPLRSACLFAPLTLLAAWPANLSYSWLAALPAAAAAVFFLAAQGRRLLALVMAVLLVLPQPVFDWAGLGERFGQGTLATVLAFWLVFAGLMLRCPRALERWLEGAQAH
ncbi:MAG: glycosyltransferase 87 family protein [Reyranellaceae bacterium]